MAFEGMDVDVVSGQVLPQMNTQLQQLESVIQAMQHVVSSLEGAWKGPDAARFASEWPSHHAQLMAAHTGLQEMRDHTQRNLQEQQSASSTGSY